MERKTPVKGKPTARLGRRYREGFFRWDFGRQAYFGNRLSFRQEEYFRQAETAALFCWERPVHSTRPTQRDTGPIAWVGRAVLSYRFSRAEQFRGKPRCRFYPPHTKMGRDNRTGGRERV